MIYMPKMPDEQQLRAFIARAAAATYAGGGAREKNPERKDFVELVYAEGDFSYRDSYTGFYRSRGMELVRQNGVPIWATMYGGGMIEGKEELADKTFTFLKKAMSTNKNGFDSFRGPHELVDGDWKYTYTQEGDVNEFHGSEEIYYQRKLIFFHRIIGGLVKGKDISL